MTSGLSSTGSGSGAGELVSVSAPEGPAARGPEDCPGNTTSCCSIASFADSFVSPKGFSTGSDPRGGTSGKAGAGPGVEMVNEGITGLSTCSFFFLIRKSLNEVLTFWGTGDASRGGGGGVD